MPGEKGPTGMARGADGTPSVVTTTFALPVNVPAASAFQGSWALICPSETNNMGAATLLNVTVTLASEVESGMESAWAVLEPSLLPKLDTSAPRATPRPTPTPPHSLT